MEHLLVPPPISTPLPMEEEFTSRIPMEAASLSLQPCPLEEPQPLDQEALEIRHQPLVCVHYNQGFKSRLATFYIFGMLKVPYLSKL